jgi:hypothetical protein
VLRRLTADWPSHGGVAWLGLAETYDKLGDDRQVVASLEQAVGAQGFDMHRDIMDADNTTNMAVRWLGAIYERRKQWQQARALYERWKPASWCGNEAEDYAHERAIRIALMDDRLGAGDEAASALKTILDAPGLNGFDLRVGLAYVELAARHGKTKAVRAEISGLEETEADARKRLRGALRMAARYEARDAAGLLDAAAPRLSREPRSRDYQPPEGAMAARLLADLGAPARTELCGPSCHGGSSAAIWRRSGSPASRTSARCWPACAPAGAPNPARLCARRCQTPPPASRTTHPSSLQESM